MHKQLKLFLMVDSFFILAMGMFGPIYAIFVREIGGDILAAGGAWATFMIISGLGIFFMGKIQDKLKREKPMIILGYILRSLGFLGYLFISNIFHLFMVQLLLGISVVIITPAYDSFYTKYLQKGKFASQWAVWESVAYTIQGVAALIGAFLVKIFGFRSLFIVMFVLSLIGLGMSTQLEDKK